MICTSSYLYRTQKIRNQRCYYGWFVDLLIDWSFEARRPVYIQTCLPYSQPYSSPYLSPFANLFALIWAALLRHIFKHRLHIKRTWCSRCRYTCNKRCCKCRSQPEMSLVWLERGFLEWPEQTCLVWPERTCLVLPEMTVDSDIGWWHSAVLALSYIYWPCGPHR